MNLKKENRFFEPVKIIIDHQAQQKQEKETIKSTIAFLEREKNRVKKSEE